MAASQADTGIASQTKTQQTQGGSDGKYPPPSFSAKPSKECPFCRGTGCSVCKPGFIETKTQASTLDKAYELDDHRKRIRAIEWMKQRIEKWLKVFKPDPIKPDPTTDKTNRNKKHNVNTYAEDQ